MDSLLAAAVQVEVDEGHAYPLTGKAEKAVVAEDVVRIHAGVRRRQEDAFRSRSAEHRLAADARGRRRTDVVYC